MKLIKFSSVFLLTLCILFGFTAQVSAKSHSKTHKHYYYKKSKSRSTFFGFNLNLDPWPRPVQNTTVFVQPAPVERVTVYNPPVYTYVPQTYVQERTYYPGYYQENVIVQRPVPQMYVQPQVSYWQSGCYY